MRAPSCHVILATAPTRRSALRLARGLVSERLAACVSVVGGLRSLYRWKGKIESASELLLVAKTRAGLAPAVSAYFRSRHPYSIYEVLALPVRQGHAPYLQWIAQSTRRP